MIYADYAYYTGFFRGTAISEEDFVKYALLASSYIDTCTMGKAVKHAKLDAVKMACCALAEQYQTIEIARELAKAALAAALTSAKESDGSTGELQSETVGSWSRTYRSGSESAESSLSVMKSTVDSAESALSSVANQYLASTGLLYRGMRCFR